MTAPTCRKCGTEAVRGLILAPTFIAPPDGRDRIVTMNMNGATLAPCWKCPTCGHSWREG